MNQNDVHAIRGKTLGGHAKNNDLIENGGPLFVVVQQRRFLDAFCVNDCSVGGTCDLQKSV